MSVARKRLGDIATFIRGITFKPTEVCSPDDDGAVVCMRTKNIQAELDETDLLAVPRRLVKRTEQMLIEGDLLISSANSWNLVGKASWVPLLDYEATAGGFISILRCDRSKAHPRYFYHWVKFDRTQAQLRNCGRQTTNISNLDFNRAENLEIPLPPLTDQERIAAILDRADSIRHKRQQALQLADEFLRSVFLELFGDPATNPKGWPTGNVRDLIASVNYGTSQKAHSERRGVPILRMNNITYKGGWNFGELKYIEFPEREREKYLVHRGEILFNRTNSRELVGKTAVFREGKPMAFAGYLVRAVAKPEADAEYVSAYLNSAHGKTVLMAMCKSIVGMANINAQEMLSIPILVPPSQLQKQFGDTVRSVVARRKEWSQADREAETLFVSLQQRAFRGEL